MRVYDDLGSPVETDGPASRVISLVPSLTESLAACRHAALVGATDWCTHPADLAVTRVRGTKNPNLAAIAALAPDLVIANKEENRELDVRRLREAGLRVWVTVVETVPQAIGSLRRLFVDALAWPVPPWLEEVARMWSGPYPPVRARTAIPIWRAPWMVVGRETFTGDLVRRLGVANHFADHAERYPRVDLASIDGSGVDFVLLPDEPYAFSRHDGPEAFTRTPALLCSGRLLTWYGPSLLTAHAELDALVTMAGFPPAGVPLAGDA